MRQFQVPIRLKKMNAQGRTESNGGIDWTHAEAWQNEETAG
jgi:hypothetical protein